MTILVTGSTGKVGSEVLKELDKRGATIRALVRKPDAKLPKGVEAIVGDLLDPVSVEKALDGADKLYLLNGVVPEELTQGLIAYGLAKKLKLKHVVVRVRYTHDVSRLSRTRLHRGRWRFGDVDGPARTRSAPLRGLCQGNSRRLEKRPLKPTHSKHQAEES
jgi:uncharacterized protein YbjT (DUF2867 family)